MVVGRAPPAAPKKRKPTSHKKTNFRVHPKAESLFALVRLLHTPKSPPVSAFQSNKNRLAGQQNQRALDPKEIT